MPAREWADPYVYQGTGVLINKPGLRDEKTFNVFQHEQAYARACELAKNPPPAKFDFEHLKSIHAHLFKDVFEWAGQPRTTDLSKGGTTFEKAQNLEAVGKRITERLQEQFTLQGLAKRQFVEKVTKLHTDLNALHPFREGNGRATREFIRQIAHAAGYELDQTRIENDKGQWNQAAAQSMRNDSAAIKEILSKAVRPSQAVAFEVLPREEAVRKHPELQPAYASLDTLQKTLAGRYPGNQKAQDHFLLQARTEAVRKLDQGNAVSSASVVAMKPLPSARTDGGSSENRRAAVMASMREQMLENLERVADVKPAQNVQPKPTLFNTTVPSSKHHRM